MGKASTASYKFLHGRKASEGCMGHVFSSSAHNTGKLEICVMMLNSLLEVRHALEAGNAQEKINCCPCNLGRNRQADK